MSLCCILIDFRNKKIFSNSFYSCLVVKDHFNFKYPTSLSNVLNISFKYYELAHYYLWVKEHLFNIFTIN